MKKLDKHLVIIQIPPDLIIVHKMIHMFQHIQDKHTIRNNKDREVHILMQLHHLMTI